MNNILFLGCERKTFVFLFLSIVFFSSLVVATTYDDCNIYGNCIPVKAGVDFNNNSAFVNSSGNWVTPSLGVLSDANSTQFDNVAGTLTIDTTYFDGIYYELSNPFTYWNDTFATFNQTFADTLYYDISNPFTYWNSTFATFNETYADTLYYSITNPFTYWNSTFATFNQSFADDLYVDVSGDTMNGTLRIINDSFLVVGVKTGLLQFPVEIVGASPGGFQIRLASVETTSTDKSGGFVLQHYDVTQEDVFGIGVSTTSSQNIILYGGGSGVANAVTLHEFYTGATSTTTTGVLRLTIDSVGDFDFKAGDLDNINDGQINDNGDWCFGSSSDSCITYSGGSKTIWDTNIVGTGSLQIFHSVNAVATTTLELRGNFKQGAERDHSKIQFIMSDEVGDPVTTNEIMWYFNEPDGSAGSWFNFTAKHGTTLSNIFILGSYDGTASGGALFNPENKADWNFNVNGESNFNGSINVTGTVQTEGFIFPNYLSITIDDTSDPISTEYNIYNQSNYPLDTMNTDDNVAARGISLDKTSGNFTVTQDGIYEININYLVIQSGAVNANYLIKINNAIVYDHTILTHSVVDPAMHPVTIIRDLSASDNVTFHVNVFSGTLTMQPGTVANIKRIATT